MMIAKIKKYKLQFITLFLYMITLIYNSDIFINSVKTTGGYLKEMVQILPAVFVISGLITVWVPRETITRHLGQGSRVKGNLLSMILGSVSAGPIYAAFPITFSLINKGASIINIVILISTWAVIKVPMLVVESKFLGINFMIVRTLLTIPSIFVISYITSKVVKKEEVLKSEENMNINAKTIIEIDSVLPHFNCGGCGYSKCKNYAESIVLNAEETNKCKVGGLKVSKKIYEIIQKISEQ